MRIFVKQRTLAANAYNEDMFKRLLFFLIPVLLAACAAAQPGPTAAPTQPLSETELKYRLLDEFPDFFFCDPDFYPLARDEETALMRQRLPEIQANAEEYGAILSHTGIAEQASLTEEQQLAIYRAHKRLAAVVLTPAGDGFSFQIQVAKSEAQQGERISGTIDPGGKIHVDSREPSFATCPICLAAGTRIDTPSGALAVEQVQPGDRVYTLGADGSRQAVPVLRVGHSRVPAGHPVLHLVLADGRELWVSPGHPTSDGLPAGRLVPGDVLDGSRVRAIERVAYDGAFTYDLLPAGPTGFYWANGILIGSTMK